VTLTDGKGREVKRSSMGQARRSYGWESSNLDKKTLRRVALFVSLQPGRAGELKKSN
jgi:hypothetical protein